MYCIVFTVLRQMLTKSDQDNLASAFAKLDKAGITVSKYIMKLFGIFVVSPNSGACSMLVTTVCEFGISGSLAGFPARIQDSGTTQNTT